MAYCKTIQHQIKTEQHIVDALNYITNPAKSFQVTYITQAIITQDIDTHRIARNYILTRKINNKENGILAHHLVQSFSKDDNITPELAHQIGKELIEKCLSDFQVTLATHIDGACLHNHIIINSVSPVDGRKFAGNKSTLNNIRQTSDDICLNHNLDIITKGTQSKYLGLDNGTLQAAKRGNSWKVQLVKDLDEAFEKCKNKNDFIEFFTSKDYEVKFTNKNITFKKKGFDKSIRADTLAKQFGNKYCKASIENKLNIKSNSPPQKKSSVNSEKSKISYQRMKLNQFAVAEWKRQEKIASKNFKSYNYERHFPKISFSTNPLKFTLKLICCIFKNYNNKQVANYRQIKAHKYKVKSYCNYEKQKQFVSNISFNKLINSAGKTAQLKLYSWQIAKLLDNNILFASKVDLTTGTALVTIKDFDITRVAKALNVSEEDLKSQSETINNRRVAYNIKSKDEKTEYLVVTQELCHKLSPYSFDIAKHPRKDGKVTLAFSSNDKNKIFTVLFPERKETNTDSFYLRNVKINRELKEYAQENNIKLNYKIVVNSQYAKLKSCNIKFAVFKQKDGKYNIVFLEKDKQEINKLIGGNKKTSQPAERKKFSPKL